MPRGSFSKRSQDTSGSAPSPSGAVFNNGVPNVTALSALNDLVLSTGTVVGVDSVGAPWILDTASTDAADAITVAVTLSGTGRWLRDLGFANPHWAKQPTWFVNAGAAGGGYAVGNDENSGLTLALPLLSVNELDRRLAGHAQMIDQATVVRLSSSSIGASRLRLSVSYRATVLVQGTMVTAFTSNAAGLTAVTNINRAVANGGGRVTDANLAVSWTASGLVGGRIRTSPAVGSPAQSWVTFDLGARQAQVGPWIQPQSAYPYALLYTPTTVSIGDPYVVETSTTFSLLELEVNVESVTGFAYPQVVVQDVSCVGPLQATTNTNDSRAVALIGCDVPQLESSGSCSFYGCRTASSIRMGGGIGFYSSCFLDGFLSTTYQAGAFLGGDQVVIDGDTIVDAGSAASSTGFEVWTDMLIGTMCIMRSTGAGLTVHRGRVLVSDQFLGVGPALYGSGNADVGVDCIGGSVDYDVKPVVTGTVGDARVGGELTPWALVPFTNPDALSSIRDVTGQVLGAEYEVGVTFALNAGSVRA